LEIKIKDWTGHYLDTYIDAVDNLIVKLKLEEIANNKMMNGTLKRKKKIPKQPALTKQRNKTDMQLAIIPTVVNKKQVAVSTPPVTIGTTIREGKYQSRNTQNGVILSGRDFVCDIAGPSGMTANASLLAMVPLHPAYYPGTIMGNLSRSYEKYRWLSLTLYFITRAPSSTNGELWMYQIDNINEPVLAGDSASFTARVLSCKTAILGPVWLNHAMNLKVDSQFRSIDAFISTDANDNILSEVRFHATAGSVLNIGFLMWDYTIEYYKPFYQSHVLPITTGPGIGYTTTCSSATPTSGNAFELTNATLSALPVGTVLRISIDLYSSTLPTGTTSANWLKVTGKSWADSSTGVSASDTTFTIVTGFTCYGVITNSTDITIYSTYDNAISGVGTGQVFYNTTGASAGSIRISAYVVRFPPVTSTMSQT
jgi:hypothetical protein